MKVIDYESWKSQVEADNEPEMCSECCGEGRQECDMGHDHDCPECDGIGEIGPDTTMQAYCTAVIADMNRLLSWCGKIPGGYPDLPMIAYCDIKSKQMNFYRVA